MSKLFSPFQIGPYTLSHRVVHAPTTRLRANADDSPSELMLEYYAQRASQGGLIITESTHVSYDSRGYLGAPGIYEDAHIPGWKKIADAVHAKGGRLFMQLGHDGRQSHVDLTGGPAPIAPSEVPFEGEALTHNGWVPVSMHRAIDIPEIQQVIEYYRKSAERALAAGLDGVELHSANGYLADTFLQDGTNKRTDAYGGTMEKRARFLLELVEALVSVWGADRVGVRLSPSGQWGSISDSNPEATFTYAAQQLNKFGLAYLHIIEPRVKGVETLDENQHPVASEFLRKVFTGPIISAGGFNGDGAEVILQKGDADLVAFGRFFASNPDLPYRLQHKLPLNDYDRSAFWGGTHIGYTDYPTYQDSAFSRAA
ncbi:alkene reductase [Undibacterium terreum]|uniref:Alkene reductase n=1 Tax=Undibacterium terreum TaxID=1224302 RepID=A0A916UCG0_9BURK|nr:alkene reductase [Undibacterium terreum]GGC66752.1 alkene reductase [Undibacterium terreum]